MGVWPAAYKSQLERDLWALGLGGSSLSEVRPGFAFPSLPPHPCISAPLYPIPTLILARLLLLPSSPV